MGAVTRSLCDTRTAGFGRAWQLQAGRHIVKPIWPAVSDPVVTAFSGDHSNGSHGAEISDAEEKTFERTHTCSASGNIVGHYDAQRMLDDQDIVLAMSVASRRPLLVGHQR